MKSRLRFVLVYWAVIASFLVIFLVKDGLDRKKELVEVQGTVVDQIELVKRYRRGRSFEIFLPQISYPVGDTNYLFVDHSGKRSTGSNLSVLYRKSDPSDAKVYTWLFWVNSGVIIPAVIISGFLFSLILIRLTNYGKKPVRLPGEFDRNDEPT